MTETIDERCVLRPPGYDLDNGLYNENLMKHGKDCMKCGPDYNNKKCSTFISEAMMAEIRKVWQPDYKVNYKWK